MAMPLNLILVRHGQSEGNLANKKARTGDFSHFSEEYRNRAGRHWKLTDLGVEQAKSSGNWLRKNKLDKFFRYYTSSFVRAKQTAAHLGLEDAAWTIETRLRERDHGDIDTTPAAEFANKYPDNARTRGADSLYWRPPGGESIADVRLRVRSMLDTLHRECDGSDVIFVCHGDFIRATRAELEYLSDEQWDLLESQAKLNVGNAEVVHYTRLNPKTGKDERRLMWSRKFCPGLMEDWAEWVEVGRKKYSNKELLDLIS